MKPEEQSNINPRLSVEEYFAIARQMWGIVGEANFRKLIDDFYHGVAIDPIMRPMYPEDLEPAKERLYLFIIQYFGGPATYTETRGHPALRARHARFPVDEQARKNWILNKQRAMELNEMPGHAKEFIMAYFAHTAEFLKNT